MALRSVATVFGGAGFLGRYVVGRLAAQGYVVRIAGRDPERARALKTAGQVGQIVPLYANVTDEPLVARAVRGADLVVNLVGILAERREGDFRRIHAAAAGQVASLSAAAGVRRLVHVSAIGADAASPSLYAQSKAEGEAAVLQAFPQATILRPSVIFGAEDKFFNMFASLIQYLPFMPVIQGDTRFQPVYVGDVADAVITALRQDDTAGRTYELGGPRVWTFRELMAWINQETRRNRVMVDMPTPLVRLQATVGEWLPGKPFTRDQLLLLQQDNVVAPNASGLDALGIVPTPVELVVPAYLDRYRQGGGKKELMPMGMSDPDLSPGPVPAKIGNEGVNSRY